MMIVGFEVCHDKSIYRYRKKNDGALPASIVVYRGGVGDGRLSYVRKTEVNSIKVN